MLRAMARPSPVPPVSRLRDSLQPDEGLEYAFPFAYRDARPLVLDDDRHAPALHADDPRSSSAAVDGRILQQVPERSAERRRSGPHHDPLRHLGRNGMAKVR